MLKKMKAVEGRSKDKKRINGKGDGSNGRNNGHNGNNGIARR